MPWVIEIIASLVIVIKAVLSRHILEKLVKLITGMPDDASKVTAEFISSRNGVKQALYVSSLARYKWYALSNLRV